MILPAMARRAALAAMASLAVPFAARAGVAENVRIGAAAVPGMGPPDIVYPSAFCGRWTLSREVVGVTGFLPDAQVGATLAYDERFVASNAPLAAAGRSAGLVHELVYAEPGACVSDRAFGAVRRAVAEAPTIDPPRAAWDLENPNVLTLEGAGGNFAERRVTKRALFESTSPRTFGASEYARLATAREGSGGVPEIAAERVKRKWKWAENPPREIEGLEIREVYDPTATGLGEGKEPTYIVKSKLVLRRPVSPLGNYYRPDDPRAPT